MNLLFVPFGTVQFIFLVNLIPPGIDEMQSFVADTKTGNWNRLS